MSREDSDGRSTADESASASPRVRVRGIYATAVTRVLLDAGAEVVQASEPIRERFDAEFGEGSHDVTVATTGDRQGVGVDGDPDAVATVGAELRDVGRDTFAWEDPTPPGAVFEATVSETLGSGAVCDLGESEGFLPYGESDTHLETGDDVRVQVRESAPPWGDRRARLGTEIRADAGLATLVRGRDGVAVDTRDDAAGRELAGMTDLLSVDVPDGWGIEWSHAATRAEMSALEAALERAVGRAEDLAAALDEAGIDGESGSAAERPATLATPSTGLWLWFGRETRFALDAARREVTTTMPGHHRTKAGSEAASVGVDLAEALWGADGAGGVADGAAESEDGSDGPDFPFDVVTRQFGPVEGDTVEIRHGKPDGRAFSLGSGEVTDRDVDGSLDVTRTLSGSGTYDGLGTRREAGDTALTKFREGRWWYPTVYRSAEGEHRGTYVNVCTPVECFPDEVRYVDLHVDVVKRPDGTVERVDDDELDAAVEAGTVPEGVAEKARAVAASLERALSE
jgi:Ribonuclease G/E